MEEEEEEEEEKDFGDTCPTDAVEYNGHTGNKKNPFNV